MPGDAGHATLPAVLRARLDALVARGGRRIVGLVGAPGSGKSTLSEMIVAAFGSRAVAVPMDGFHLAQSELERLGRAARKGAPDTFDTGGYVALLRRIRQSADETVYAPAFRREIEEPVAGAIAVAPAVPLVVTEGNYLLLDGPWASVRALLDETWFLDTDETRRDAWLLARHVSFGRTEDAARAWIEATDAPNARLIAASGEHADVRVPWPIV